MIDNINAIDDVDDRIRIRQIFNVEEDRKKFYQYYNPISDLIMNKSQENDRQLANESLEYENAVHFEEFCENKNSLFLSKKTFMGYIDLERLLECIKKSNLEGIYHIIEGIKRVYDFQNLYDFYYENVSLLKKLKEDIQNSEIIEWNGKTKEYAKKYFVDALDDIIKKIER